MEDGQFTLILKDGYPLDDTLEVAGLLGNSTALIAGWILPERGLLDLPALAHAMFLEEYSIALLPDRNIVSRMAEIAREGQPRKRDKTTETAMRMMAFAQAVDWDIDPGLAFHELAQKQGNEAAWDELAWFRTADENAVQSWLDLALGRASNISLGSAKERECLDFAGDLLRWTRNYIVTLKIAELELGPLAPIDKFYSLANWMVEGFIVAGPALLFAARYWGTCGNRAGMIKKLQSPNRDRAIEGCANAAWDITYLSLFALRISKGEEANRRYILATCDELLAEIAPYVMYGPERIDNLPSLAEGMLKWWGPKDADKIANRMLETQEIGRSGRLVGANSDGDPIAAMIEQGENIVRVWSGNGP